MQARRIANARSFDRLGIAYVASFDRENLVEAAGEAFLIGLKLGGHKSAGQLERQFGADDACAENQDVHIVVLDTLVGGISVVANAGANAGNFVGGDADSDAGAADEDAAGRGAGYDRLAYFLGKIGVIVEWLVRVRPDIDQFVAGSGEMVAHLIFEGETGVIASNDEFHSVPFPTPPASHFI